MKKDTVFAAKFKDGELVMRAMPTEFDQPYMLVSYRTDNGEQNILQFWPEIMNTKAYGPESIGIYDSESAELGEIVYQMHGNDSIDRPPFPYGIFLCITDDFDEPEEHGKKLRDLTFVSEPGFMDTLASLCIQYIRSRLKRIAPRILPLYFVYFGIAETTSFVITVHDESTDTEELAEISAIGQAVFDACQKSEKFGVCRCVAALTSDETCYLAIAGETKDPSFSFKIERLIRQVKEYPRKVRRRDDEDMDW